MSTSKGKGLGNQRARKWDPELSWYMHRVTGDLRKHCKSHEEYETIHQHLRDVWTGKCAISGLPLYRKDYHGRTVSDNPFHIASVDRIDCNRPYQIGNMQWVSVAMNRARNNIPLEQFKQFFKETF